MDIDQSIVEIWKEVLKTDKFEKSTSFLAMAKGSIETIQMLTMVNEKYKINLSVEEFFKEPTIDKIISLVEKSNVIDTTKYYPTPSEKHDNVLPLTRSQEGLMYINQEMDGRDASYNILISKRLLGKLSVDALVYSFNALIQRHESLRIKFLKEGDNFFQTICNPENLEISIEKIKEKNIFDKILLKANYFFDLFNDQLIKVHLFQISSEDHILIINIHHIIFDGWSVGILNRELSELYNAYINKRIPSLPDVRQHFSDFIYFQRNYLQGEVLEERMNFWKSLLCDSSPYINFSKTSKKENENLGIANSCLIDISEKTIKNLNEISKKTETTLFMLFYSVFNIILACHKKHYDICMGVPFANRKVKEFENSIGYFVNLLILRTKLEVKNSFKYLLNECKQTITKAYSYQDTPFRLILKEFPAMQHINVLFVFQNYPEGVLELENINSSSIEIGEYNAKFDLILEILTFNEKLVAKFEYRACLFESNEIEKMAKNFMYTLNAISKDIDINIYELHVYKSFNTI